jgi:hypothetical protein
MKKTFLTAFMVLGLAVTALAPVVASAHEFHNGSSLAGNAAATRIQQTTTYQ